MLNLPAAVPVLSQTSQSDQEALDESVYLKWEQVSSLRSQGQFTEAIAVLQEIINDPKVSDEVLQRAYNDLVFTYYLERDVEGAREQARVALVRFPSLTADPVAFPPRVNETYDQLRREMFGSVTITKPDQAQVVLDGELRGETPLHMDLLSVGTHELKLVKPGYHDYTETIVVDPNGRHVYEISMDRDRGAGWWLARGAVIVGAGVLIAVLASGSGDEEQVALGDPPPPPPR
jgi:hypothetical protein